MKLISSKDSHMLTNESGIASLVIYLIITVVVIGVALIFIIRPSLFFKNNSLSLKADTTPSPSPVTASASGSLKGFTINPSQVTITIPAGKEAQVLTLTSREFAKFEFSGTPTTYGPGINWSIASANLQPGDTLNIGISVNSNIPAGTYSGIGKIINLTSNTSVTIPITVSVPTSSPTPSPTQGTTPKPSSSILSNTPFPSPSPTPSPTLIPIISGNGLYQPIYMIAIPATSPQTGLNIWVLNNNNTINIYDSYGKYIKTLSLTGLTFNPDLLFWNGTYFYISNYSWNNITEATYTGGDTLNNVKTISGNGLAYPGGWCTVPVNGSTQIWAFNGQYPWNISTFDYNFNPLGTIAPNPYNAYSQTTANPGSCIYIYDQNHQSPARVLFLNTSDPKKNYFNYVDTSGNYIGASTNSYLNNPQAIDLNTLNNDIYITNQGNDTVTVFDQSGNYIKTISGHGFNKPSAILNVGGTQMWVANSGNSTISIITP